MKYIYLDHNVYIETLEDNDLYDFLNAEKNNKDIKFLYSPAHIEEIYKVKSNGNSKFKDKMEPLMLNISEITCNSELSPSKKNIILRRENPLDCYRRIESNDTTKIIEYIGDISRREDCEKFDSLSRKEQKSISTIPFNEILENEIIKSELAKLDNSIKKYNLACALMNKKGLTKNFSFKKGNFNNLRNSFHDLEFTIQELFRVLNFCGYKGERKENTNTSRIHDVTHAIYATKSNYLISADSKFVDKCKAVYYYLGVATEVIYTKLNNIKNTLNDII